MKEPKYTPGPWEVMRSICGHYPVVGKRFRPDHHMHVTGPIHGYMYSDDKKGEQKANANLIATAPEMYDLLASIENDAGQVPGWLWGRIQECLAKARGEDVEAV